MLLKSDVDVVHSQILNEKETKEEKEIRLMRLLVKVISDAKAIRISGKNYFIKKMVNVFVKLPKEVASLVDGEYEFKAQADIYFVPFIQTDEEISFGLTDFHGKFKKESEKFYVEPPIVLDKEIGVVVNSLKPSM